MYKYLKHPRKVCDFVDIYLDLRYNKHNLWAKIEKGEVMEINGIYDLLVECKVISEDFEQIQTDYLDQFKELRNELSCMISDNAEIKLKSLINALVEHMFITRDIECKRCFHIGVKIGMDLENFEED